MGTDVVRLVGGEGSSDEANAGYGPDSNKRIELSRRSVDRDAGSCEECRTCKVGRSDCSEDNFEAKLWCRRENVCSQISAGRN